MSYLPNRLADLRNWAVNFSTLITASPTSYGLTAGNATTISTAVGAFTTAYTASVDPSTRTSATVAATRVARVAMVQTIRQFAAIIRSNPSVTAGQLMSLGLTVRDITPTPVPPPDTFPLLDVLNATVGRHELRFADSSTPDSRAKPAGATGLQLFRAIGTGESPTPEGAELIGTFTANPLRIDTPLEDGGKVATYFGRWITQRGLVGPWSNGISYTIAA